MRSCRRCSGCAGRGPCRRRPGSPRSTITLNCPEPLIGKLLAAEWDATYEPRRASNERPRRFYAQLNAMPCPARCRETEIDAAVGVSFDASEGTYGSLRVLADLRAEGWRVSKKTVESLMARQGLRGRRPRRRRRSRTRPDGRQPALDLLRRDFSAGRVDQKWVGDFKQIHTLEGPVFLWTVEDLFSRRLLGFALSDRPPTAELGRGGG